MMILLLIEYIFLSIIGLIVFTLILLPYFFQFLAKVKILPNMYYLMSEYKIDILKKPYTDWMKKSMMFFYSMLTLELYLSYIAVSIIKLIIGKRTDKKCC